MRRLTVYDINPELYKKFFKIRAQVQCFKCKRVVSGDLILDREELKVQDSSGFLIFKEIECDECSKDFQQKWDKMVTTACHELGYEPEDLGIGTIQNELTLDDIPKYEPEDLGKGTRKINK